MTPSEIAVDYLPCDYCGARKGEPCRARSRTTGTLGRTVSPHADRTDAVRAAYLAGIYEGFSDGLATVVDTVRRHRGDDEAEWLTGTLSPYYRAVLTRTP